MKTMATRQLILLMIMGLVITLLVLFMIAESEAQTTQNMRRWDLWSGSWDTFTAIQDSNTAESDTIWFNYTLGSDSVFYTEAFKCWPIRWVLRC